MTRDADRGYFTAVLPARPIGRRRRRRPRPRRRSSPGWRGGCTGRTGDRPERRTPPRRPSLDGWWSTTARPSRPTSPSAGGRWPATTTTATRSRSPTRCSAAACRAGCSRRSARSGASPTPSTRTVPRTPRPARSRSTPARRRARCTRCSRSSTESSTAGRRGSPTRSSTWPRLPRGLARPRPRGHGQPHGAPRSGVLLRDEVLRVDEHVERTGRSRSTTSHRVAERVLAAARVLAVVGPFERARRCSPSGLAVQVRRSARALRHGRDDPGRCLRRRGSHGRTVCRAVAADPDLELVAAVDPHHAGIDLRAATGVAVPDVHVAPDARRSPTRTPRWRSTSPSVDAARANLGWCAEQRHPRGRRHHRLQRRRLRPSFATALHHEQLRHRPELRHRRGAHDALRRAGRARTSRRPRSSSCTTTRRSTRRRARP